MPRTGFEPAQAEAHQPLKLARLPIPPPGRLRFTIYDLLFSIGPRLRAYAGIKVLLTIIG